MKAIVCPRYGDHSVLELRDVPKPVPLEGEVLVEVRAVSLNDWDWAYITGKPYIYRLMSGMLRPKFQILGSDIAGVVIALGPGVSHLKLGDRVYGDLSERWGGFAEYVSAPEKSLAKMPESMSFEDAAALPQAGMLAAQGLLDVGGLQKGWNILINGAGGGVGTLGVQIARQYGCRVTAVDNTGKLDFMKQAGFDDVIDYTKTDFTRTGNQYDLILDNKTKRPVHHFLRALKPGGIYVTTGGNLRHFAQVFLFGKLLEKISGKKFKMVMLKMNKDLPLMNQMYEAGKLKPKIGKTFTLEQVPEAFRIYGKEEHKGKLVVTPLSQIRVAVV